jgi:hypothetical protein
MSSQLGKFLVPIPVGEPRGARWVASLVNAAGAAGRAWTRVRRGPPSPSLPGDENALLAMAKRMEHDTPALAVELRAIAMHEVKQAS